MGKKGKRQYVQVLRLMETFRLEDVRHAIREAMHLQALSFDAVKHLVLCHINNDRHGSTLSVIPIFQKLWFKQHQPESIWSY